MSPAASDKRSKLINPEFYIPPELVRMILISASTTYTRKELLALRLVNSTSLPHISTNFILTRNKDSSMTRFCTHYSSLNPKLHTATTIHSSKALHGQSHHPKYANVSSPTSSSPILLASMSSHILLLPYLSENYRG
jgi:hypothetical protein